MPKLSKYKNPDKRPLPGGWSQHYDKQLKIWFYVKHNAVPKIRSNVHPSDARQVLLDNLTDRQFPNNARMEVPRHSNEQSAIYVNRSIGFNTQQQLYGNSLNPPASPALPSTRPPNSGNSERSTHALDSHMVSKSLSSINLSAPAPAPFVTTAHNAYPPQLLAYLANGANLSKYSNPNRHSTAQPAAPSRPSSSRSPTGSVQDRMSVKPASRESMSAPPNQIHFPHTPHGVPHRTRSYMPSTAPSPPEAVLPRSSTSSMRGSPSPALSSSSTPAPRLANRQQSLPQLHHVSSPSAPSLLPPGPAPKLQWISNRPSPQPHVSASEPTPSSYPSPPTNFVSPQTTSASPPINLAYSPASYPFPANANQSPSITFSSPARTSLPSTPALTHSASSQPPTPLMSPTPLTPQASSPSRAPVASQPAPKKGRFMKNTMSAMAGVAAVGILKGAVSNILGGDDGDDLDMNGLVDEIGNMMDGEDGNDVGLGGGDNGFQLFSDSLNQDNAPYAEPSNSYFDPSSQGNSDGPDSTSIFNQTNSYDQYQQQSGPDYAHIAHDQTHHASKPQQHHQQMSHYGGAPAVAGQAPSGAQNFSQHNTSSYPAAHNAYHSGPHGQAAQYGQSHQHSQTGLPGQTHQPAQAAQPFDQKQGIKINANHVKQAAKGALLAGRVLAKLNGVNLGNGNG